MTDREKALARIRELAERDKQAEVEPEQPARRLTPEERKAADLTVPEPLGAILDRWTKRGRAGLRMIPNAERENVKRVRDL